MKAVLYHSLRRARLGACVLGAPLLAGCIGVSAKPLNPDGTAAPARYCPRGIEVAPDGLVDDMNDGNKRVDVTAGRGGYWWSSADPAGSEIGPADFLPETPPGGESPAIHAFGKTAAGGGDDNWGAQFGAGFTKALTYDASKYAGIRFRAKVGPDSTQNIRFRISDVNTHPNLGVCTACWNHFGRDLNLTEEWQEFEMLFSSLQQLPYWGSPRPASIAAAELHQLSFEIGKGKAFDIWVDDIAFIKCK